jgi:acyl carrier protein
MSRSDIATTLRDVFASVFDDPDFQLIPALRMGEIEVWDSFNHINLMLAVEGAFGIEFDSSEIAELLSVGDIESAIKRHTAE